MNLIVTWDSPTPYPACDFDISYRRNYDPAYTLINTSGTTSGGTRYITVSAPACFEGFITSDCCSGNKSDAVPFGVNAYQPLTTTVQLDNGNTVINAHILTTYINSYNTAITGTFDLTQGIVTETIPFSVTFPAGYTNAILHISGASASPTPVISNQVITAMVPVYDGGGALQQYDSVSTPPYFQYYNGATSGITWGGSPIELPSFILRAFIVTAVDTNGNPIAGNLIISWIASSIYGGGVSPYNEVIFRVYDPDTSLMGQTIALPVNGFIEAVIPVTRVTAPLNTGTEFTMKTFWGDNTLSKSKLFYLPAF